MKNKSLILFFLLFTVINTHSQTVSISRMFKWNSYRTVSENYEVSRLYSQRGGKVLFYTNHGKEYIRITGYDGGDKIWYEGKVVLKKTKSIDGNEESYVYLILDDKTSSWKFFIQIFEIYDVTISKSVPIRFLLHVTDLNGNFITGRFLEDINK